jgi:hypothetical protein
MEFTTFLTTVFCLVDDWLKGQRIRRRGPQPTLSDSEVLTIEIVGDFMGVDTDEGLYEFFRRGYGDWFPALRRIHRTTFLRQAANLWHVKGRLWQLLRERIQSDALVSVMDSFPIPLCRFARARRCRRLREEAAYGYDDVARHVFWGWKGHLVLEWPGVIGDFRLAPANLSDVEGASDLLAERRGWTLGDRNYWCPRLKAECQEHGLSLLAPFQSAKREKRRWPRMLQRMRYRIDTVIGQLVERYHAQKVWARDRWHLLSRWLRKVLSHTMAVFLCLGSGLPPLSFDELLVE